MIHRGAEQAEPETANTADAARPEGHGEGLVDAVGERRGGRAERRRGGQGHADVAREAGRHATEDEADGPPQPGLAERQRDSSGSTNTSVDVKNTIRATGTRMTPIVRNRRWRYAEAPSWMARAISLISARPARSQDAPGEEDKLTLIANSAAAADSSTVHSPPLRAKLPAALRS